MDNFKFTVTEDEDATYFKSNIANPIIHIAHKKQAGYWKEMYHIPSFIDI